MSEIQNIDFLSDQFPVSESTETAESAATETCAGESGITIVPMKPYAPKEFVWRKGQQTEGYLLEWMSKEELTGAAGFKVVRYTVAGQVYHQKSPKRAAKAFLRDGVLYFTSPGTQKGVCWTFNHDVTEAVFQSVGHADHARAWASIARLLYQHRVNLEFAGEIVEHLAGKREFISSVMGITRTDAPRVKDFGPLFAELRGKVPADFSEAYGLMFAEGVSRSIKKYSDSRLGRDLTVSITPGAPASDGVPTWRASGASELHRCANGDYFLMFTPTKGVFVEND